MFANLKGQSAHFKGKTISALEGLGIELRTLEFDFYTQDWSGREDALTNSATSAAYSYSFTWDFFKVPL